MLASLLYSKEIIIDSDLDSEYTKDFIPDITAIDEILRTLLKTNFIKVGYIYSIGSLSKEFDKYAHGHSFYISEIYKNIGLNLIKKTHSSNLSYDIFGFGLNYPISKKWLILINKISGEANSISVDGIDFSLLFLKDNYGFSLGYDSVLQQSHIGITLLKGFNNE